MFAIPLNLPLKRETSDGVSAGMRVMGLGVGKVGNPQGLHYGVCDVVRTENSPEPPPFSNGDSGECPSNGSGIGKNRLLNLVAVNGAGQVVEVVTRCV